MTDALERALLAHLRRVTHTSAPQWSEVHKAWIVELSFPAMGNLELEDFAAAFRIALERYREQESAG